jgi:hypothetical protein
MVFTTVRPSVRLSVRPSVRPSVRVSVDGHLVRTISQQRLELGISYSVYRLIFMWGCANVTFRSTLTYDLATVTFTLKFLSARFLSNGLS